MTTKVTIGRPGQFHEFERHCTARLERAAKMASHIAATRAKDEIRREMQGAGLGRLGNAIGTTSDELKNRIHRDPGGGFSASGVIFVRGNSERTRGAIESYAEGSKIAPKRGRWLWIATRQIPTRSQRFKMTPELYRKNGLEERIGPLVFLQTSPSEALYVVENVTVHFRGRTPARRLPKRGRIGPTRRKRDFIIAFVGIRNTARTARFNPEAIIAANAARIPELIAAQLEKDR